MEFKNGFYYENGRKYTAEEYEQIRKAEEAVDAADLLQLTKKIQLNSAYGALLSPHFRFGRKEMGASVTATGRQITTFMMETISETLTGNREKVIKTTTREKDGSIKNEYSCKSNAIIYGDTDSVEGTSLIRTERGTETIESIFNRGATKLVKDGKEFSIVDGLQSWTSDGAQAYKKPVMAVYRHKVSKAKWRITDSTGKSVVVTNDHSLMIMRAGKLLEVKPSEMNKDTDFLVSIC